MEAFLVPKAAAEPPPPPKQTRARYDKAAKEKFIYEARHIGPSAAAQKLNIPEGTGVKWFLEWKKNGRTVEEPEKRGRLMKAASTN